MSEKFKVSVEETDISTFWICLWLFAIFTAIPSTYRIESSLESIAESLATIAAAM